MPNFTFYGERKQEMATFSSSFWTSIWFLGIRPKQGSLAFVKANELETHRDRDWKNANSLFKRRFRGRRRRGILNSLS